MRIVVTGGAGFHRLPTTSARCAARCLPGVRGRARRRAGLAHLRGHAHQPDRLRRGVRARRHLATPTRSPARWRARTWWCTSRPSRMWTGRSPGAADFVSTNVVGTQVLLAGALAAGVDRFVHVSTDEVYGSIDEGSWPRPIRSRPTRRTRRPRRVGPARARLPPHARPGRLHHAVFEQLRAPPVPGEGDPALRDEPARRAQGAALRRRAERARLAARGRPLPRHSARGREGARRGRSTTSAAAPS
jgi:hypothetical protein